MIVVMLRIHAIVYNNLKPNLIFCVDGSWNADRMDIVDTMRNAVNDAKNAVRKGPFCQHCWSVDIVRSVVFK